MGQEEDQIPTPASLVFQQASVFPTHTVNGGGLSAGFRMTSILQDDPRLPTPITSAPASASAFPHQGCSTMLCSILSQSRRDRQAQESLLTSKTDI